MRPIYHQNTSAGHLIKGCLLPIKRALHVVICKSLECTCPSYHLRHFIPLCLQKSRLPHEKRPTVQRYCTKGFMWEVPMVSRVLQCVVVCCSVLQCVAVCCIVLQHVSVCVPTWEQTARHSFTKEAHKACSEAMKGSHLGHA